MIEKMEKLYIYSIRNQSADIMEEVLKCGVVQTEQTLSMLPEDTAKVLAPGESLDLSGEEALMERIQESMAAIRPFSHKKGLFSKRTEVSYEDLTDDQILVDTLEVCDEIESVVREISDKNKELRNIEFRRASYLPWKSMELAAEDMETETCGTSCYILQEPRTIEDIRAAAAEKDIAMYAEEVCSEKENHYIAVIFYKRDERKAKEAISVFGAREFSVDGMKGTFCDNISLCDSEISRLRAEIELKEKSLEQMADRMDGLQMASDAIKVRMQALSGQENFMHTDKVDIISGWIPSESREALSGSLEKFDCYCEYAEPDEDEDFPVKIKNSRIVEPFGAITEMYSLPNPHSIDTNWAIGLFFFIFFGMMLSDAGYGLILTLGGLLGAKYLDVGDGMKRLMRMIGIAGISTIFWGALYGSWFGDVVPTVAETFFGKSVEIPMLIDPLNEPMKVLIMSCIFGVIHLFVGMGIKAYIMIRRGDILGAVFDVGFWYVFLIGLPMLLAPGVFGTVGKVMSIVGAAGLVLTQGRHKPTVIGKITSGVMSLYDVTSYFSDVLSYSRILALGLATGVIASVVNILASMAGNNIIGIILFIVIFIFGHLLNLAINALGAYVHSARLQYVEFFGKYYEGGGVKFNPLKIKTKYVKVTEEK